MPIKPRNPNNIRSEELGAAHEDHAHAHSDLTGIGTDDHHAEAHTIASHSDTTATGAELETLTDGSDADALHTHPTNTPLTEEQVEDFVGGMVTGNTETRITVTYEDSDGTLDFVVDADLSNYTNTPGWIADITGENLEDLANVTITSVASGEVIQWNGTAWINRTLAEAGIAAASHTHELDELDATGHTDGHVLTADGANGAAWEAPTTGVTDHGALTGLADDDHTEYLNDTRHNAAHGAMRAVRATSDQSMATGSENTAIFNSIVNEDDPDNDFTLNTSTGVLTINNAGWYHFDIGMFMASSDATLHNMQTKVNGTGTSSVASKRYNTNDGARVDTFSLLIKLAATDTIQFTMAHNASGSVNFLATPASFMAVVKLREA